MNITLPYERGRFHKRTMHADTNDPDKFTVETTEDVSVLANYCKDRMENTRFDKRDGLVHVAEIPMFIYEKARLEGWDNPDGWKRWLNDPANKIFRTWKGNV